MLSVDAINAASIFLIFMEGVLSFFSPCVLPLLPVYMGYLSGNVDMKQPHAQRNIFYMTLCFIVGIFTAIFLLNTGIAIFSSFFKEHMTMLIRIGGIIIIVLGIHQLGIVKFRSLERTRKLNVRKTHTSSFLFAFLLGFTFSFSWTPCIGPALSSVLILAGSSQSFLLSNVLMLVYALGLTLPFLMLGLFTNKALSWFSRHANVMKYTVKIGAVILILIGAMMLSGKMNAISNYMSPPATADTSKKEEAKEEDKSGDSQQNDKQAEEQKTSDSGLSFAMKDQHGNTINIADYRGKVVFVNFWATWCPPCKAEMPNIQELYDKYKNSEDVAVITIVRPGGQERDRDGILDFLKQNGYTMPVLFDDGSVSDYFQIYSFPTTHMLKKDGTPFGFVKGQLTPDIMEQIIQKTLDDEK